MLLLVFRTLYSTSSTVIVALFFRVSSPQALDERLQLSKHVTDSDARQPLTLNPEQSVGVPM
jgi:hypothetical protein